METKQLSTEPPLGKERSKKEIRDFLELNENKVPTCPNFETQ